jgi:hypothetical protein
LALVEATVNGGSSNGIFAAAIGANDGMVVAASTVAAQLRMTSGFIVATIGQRLLAADAIASLSLHPTTASFNDDRHQQRPPLPRLPSTTASINNDHHCRC